LQEIQDELLKKLKVGFIKAQDVCDIVTSEKLQNSFLWLGIQKPSILLATAKRWLGKLKWHYNKIKNRMYIDGHECDNIVAYQQVFIY